MPTLKEFARIEILTALSEIVPVKETTFEHFKEKVDVDDFVNILSHRISISRDQAFSLLTTENLRHEVYRLISSSSENDAVFYVDDLLKSDKLSIILKRCICEKFRTNVLKRIQTSGISNSPDSVFILDKAFLENIKVQFTKTNFKF